MDTEIIKINKDDIDEKLMEHAGELIAKGELVAFPTETVYGLGGDALDPEASRKIYAAKGRPSDNPLIVHISEFSDLKRIVKTIPPEAKKLSDAFWPGPLTMILEKSEAVPDATTGGMDIIVKLLRRRYPYIRTGSLFFMLDTFFRMLMIQEV